MALALAEEFALVPTGPAAGKRLILPFGKNQFYVPASAVELGARKISQVENGTALGQLLYTKTPDKWHDYCHPKHLFKIKAKDGSTCIYTTFIVPGNDDESLLLRLVNSTVAEKNFKEWKQKFDEQIEKKTIVISTERQQKCLDVLNWKKEVDCANRNQINPEIEQWKAVPKANTVRSCMIRPESKPRKLKARERAADDNAPRKAARYAHAPTDAVEWEAVYRVGPKGTYTVTEVGNCVHILQYKHEHGTVALEAPTDRAANGPVNDAGDAERADEACNGADEPDDDDDDDDAADDDM